MKFFSIAFGCRVNEAEKETIDKALIEKGFIFDEKNPDVYIINTCAVTHKAEREARNLIYQIRKKHPKAKIIITGCAATYWLKNKLYQNLPVDYVIHNQNKASLPDKLQKTITQSLLKIQKLTNCSKFLSSHRLLVKIQDGCQRFCTFCIVPYLRGLPKSFTIKEIISFINQQQKEKPITEVILTAINTEAFGYDTGENFIDLIDEIIKKTSIPRVSFGSIHPWSITPQFINSYQKILTTNRLVNFFHIPIQSGSNTILKLMKREYKIEEISEKLHALKKINPLAFLATDIIVGFLGETDIEFEKTYQFLEQSPISRFHVFRFSKRKNTAAYFMAKNIKEPTEKEKKLRSQSLRALSQKKYLKFLEENLERKTTALILNKKEKDYFHGLLDNQLHTLIKANKNFSPGEIINVKTTEIKNSTLLSKKI